MSRYTIGVSDFRIIQKASVKPEGITLIAGGNGEGKSTLIKALRAMLGNDAAGNERHGTDGFGVAVQVGDNKLLYMRNRDKTSVKFNDENERTKLGQNPLYAIEPRFPLKRYDFVDSRFFPNFAMQNSVPVFNEIPIQELFSTMFGSVAKVSDRVTHCRNSCVNTSKERDTAESNSKLFKAKIAEQSKSHDALLAQVPNLETTYNELGGLAERKEKADAFALAYAQSQSNAPDEELRALMPYVEGARALFPLLTFVEAVEGVLEQLALVKEQLAETEALLKDVPIVPVELVSLMADKVRMNLEWQGVMGTLGSMPTVDPELVRLVGAVSVNADALATVDASLATLPNVNADLIGMVGAWGRIQSGLEATVSQLAAYPAVDPLLIEWGVRLYGNAVELDKLNDAVGVVLVEESEIKSELAKVPCQRLAEGNCPTAAVGTLKA